MKVNKDPHTPLTFNNNIVYQATLRELSGVILDNHLSFEEHVRLVFSKINKTIGLLLQASMPQFFNSSVLQSQYQHFLLYTKILLDNIYIVTIIKSKYDKIFLYSKMILGLKH